MTHFSVKSQVHRLVTVLSFVGEYPAHSHHLLGKERVMNQGLYRVVSDKPAFYLAKDIKRVGGAEMNKTMFTRMAGAVFSPGGCYAVYNTRASAMKWSGMGEFKALHSLMEIGRMNAGFRKLIQRFCLVSLTRRQLRHCLLPRRVNGWSSGLTGFTVIFILSP